MTNPFNRTLPELLAAAEKRKYDTIRATLNIPDHLDIRGLQLESLAYHLSERSGLVHVKLEGDALRVGEPGHPGSLPYYGDSIGFLLATWGLTLEQAREGVTLELDSGAPKASRTA